MISWCCKQVVIWHAFMNCTQHVKTKQAILLIVMWNVCICGYYLWTHCTCIKMCFLLCLILLAILEWLGNSRSRCSVLSSMMCFLFDVFCHSPSSCISFLPTTHLYMCWKQIYAKTCILASFALHLLNINLRAICPTFKDNIIWCTSFAVNPPSDLSFKIIDERTVQMSWYRPPDAIEGYRITVTPATTGKIWYSFLKMWFGGGWMLLENSKITKITLGGKGSIQIINYIES